MADYDEMNRDRARRGGGRTTSDLEMEIADNSMAVQAAKEVDSERREIDEVNERMRSRQRYFFEKAQMFREAADHYARMAEDIAELLNNAYVDGKKKSKGSDE